MPLSDQMGTYSSRTHEWKAYIAARLLSGFKAMVDIQMPLTDQIAIFTIHLQTYFLV